MSEWINIDRLGSRGVEPDLIPTDRPPESLDMAVNMRSVGTNLANAGGYAAVPNGAIPDEVIPSNCSPCPQIFLDYSIQNGETIFDRSWDWDYNDPKRYICVAQVNAGGQDYDQTIHVGLGECNDARQGRVEVKILNTAAARRVQILLYDATGALTATDLDYDASSIFGDGQVHWVVIEQYDAAGNRVGFNIFIDDTQVANQIEPNQVYVSRFTSMIRENSPFALSLPIAFYRFSQTLWDCLTSGNFNGFGRCVGVKQDGAFQFDRTLTDVDLDLYADDRIATPKLGTLTRRTAYLDHGTMTGKIYVEWVRDFAPCASDDYYIGGVSRGLSLGTDVPGSVPGSWGYTGPDGRLQVDGNPDTVIGYLNILMARTLIAIDIDQGLLYLGGGEDATPSWIGGGTPGAGATSWAIGTSASDMQLVSNFFNTRESVCFLSSARSCRHAAPSGFGYLGQP